QPQTSLRDIADNVVAAFRQDQAGSPGETQSGIVCMAFSGDQRVLAVGTASGYSQTIDLVQRKLLAPVFHQVPVGNLAFAPDACSLLVASFTGDVTRWWRSPDAPQLLSGHQGSVRFVALDSTGQRGVTGGVDGQLNVWD